MDNGNGPVCNTADAPGRSHGSGAWGGTCRVLTPSMRPRILDLVDERRRR